MRVVFDDEALDDLQHIRTWIARDSPRAADQLITRIFDRIESLLAPELTYMGRPGLDPGTHELIEHPYIIVYEVHDDRGRLWCSPFCTAHRSANPKENSFLDHVEPRAAVDKSFDATVKWRVDGPSREGEKGMR